MKAIKHFFYTLFIENWTIKVIAGIITAIIYLITRSQ